MSRNTSVTLGEHFAGFIATKIAEGRFESKVRLFVDDNPFDSNGILNIKRGLSLIVETPLFL